MSKPKGIIIKLRESKTFKGLAVCLVLNLLAQIVQPTAALALTEGPSQPEVQSFEPIGTTQMVDLFSGDFNYNIPLFNLPGPNGGYPVNLSYHAGVSMDDEASWVGLGWNINAGSLVRNMRGLPDEFMSELHHNYADYAHDEGDYLEVKQDMKENMTIGVRANTKSEVFGGDLEKWATSLGASVYYNNYRGFGMSLDAGLTYGHDVQGGLSLSADSENGLGVTASVELTSQADWATNSHQLSLTFDGNLSIDYALKRHSIRGEILSTRDPVAEYRDSYGNSITFARSGFNPSLSFQTTNWNFSGGFHTGPEVAGLFVAGGASIFLNTQNYSDREQKGRKHLVIGYDKAGNTNSSDYSRDFTRENDGSISKATKYLPSTHYTYDTYHSTGQGLSGFFRPRRNDVGRSFDTYMSNYTFGGNISFEVGGGAIVKGGMDGGINFGWASQGDWSGNRNDLGYDFSDPLPVKEENLYYQAHGEPTILESSDLNYMNGLDLVKLQFAPEGVGTGSFGGKKALRTADNPNAHKGKKNDGAARNKRNTTIHNLRNKEVYTGANSAAVLGEFDIRYYSSTNFSADPTHRLDRSTRGVTKIDDHYAGFKILNEGGSYYTYALPAYNHKETDNLFSVRSEGTDAASTGIFGVKMDGDEVNYKDLAKGHQFIRKTTKSPYAHSYMLTSVQGADYVDVTNNGPSDDDLGYWVKFDYVKHADQFKWRAPYKPSEAFYSEGSRYTREDDKASYQYGEKELWYVGRIETKSHIAVFELEAREDMMEAEEEASEDVGNLTDNQTGLLIRKIKIYEKKSYRANPSTAIPLQVVHFNYSYRLCANTENSRATSPKGKLTLDEVYFTSNGSDRGELNKYKFGYSTVSAPQLGNPNYQQGAYDSWGTYKPKLDHEFASNFPYVNQFNQDWNTDVAWEPGYAGNAENDAAKELTKNTQAKLASAWCLNKVTLPSGGYINIVYESDDYGYVQHKVANQMFKIESMGINGSGENQANVLYEDETEFVSDVKKRRIYFKLEDPIATGQSMDDMAAEVYNRYVKPIHEEGTGSGKARNLYFKAKMELTDNVKEYVSGYLPLERDLKQSDGSTYFYGVATSNAELNGHAPTTNAHYNYGFVTIQAARKPKDQTQMYSEYHPMSLAAWTFMQTNLQELLHNPNSFSTDDMPDGENVGDKIHDFFNIIPMIAESFGSIRKYCKNQHFANKLDLDYSCIRLASPDKSKYGGGHRVKRITITDNWSGATNTVGDTRTYGQEFSYTTTDEDGRTISSGVAAYEPQAGGDENALKYPYYYIDRQSLRTRNNLFAEAPFNESLFPGAMVGYSKVTVKTLNTSTQLKNIDNTETPATGRTGGITVNEFYTAKDFPTMVSCSELSEKNNTMDHYRLIVPIPLIGVLTYNYYHGTQAYKIELNDMHGKVKSIKTYETNGYTVNPNPITESSYEYLCHPINYMGEKVFMLDNEVPIIDYNVATNTSTHIPQSAKKLMGVEVDLFTDQRESKTFHNSMGLDMNVDIPAIPVPSIWPSYSGQKTLFRTYVTNKVVSRTGILIKTKARDLQTVNESEVVAFDSYSGQPLLTKVKNEFGDDFYNYNVPAWTIYNEMGHAFRNIDFRTNVTLDAQGCNYIMPISPNPELLNYMVRGDELLLKRSDGTYYKGYFLGWKYDGRNATQGIVDIPDHPNMSKTTYDLRVIRSGRRNHYATAAASYTTKGSIEDIGLTSTNSNGPDGIPYAVRKINGNVLSANASLYSDNWMDEVQGEYKFLEVEEPRPNGEGFHTVPTEGFLGIHTTNPFLAGRSGIWRPYKSYAFAGERKASGSMTTSTGESNNPELYDDGVFETPVPLFNWELSLEYYESTFGDWEWTNEITRFSKDAYELENVNRLDVYSSALYGYDNSLTIGVGGNASYRELGVLDFENARTTGDVKFGETMEQTNLSFYETLDNLPKAMLVSERKNFYDAAYNAAQNEIIVTFNFPNTTQGTTEQGKFVSLFENVAEDHSQYGGYGSTIATLENTFGLSLSSREFGGVEGSGNAHFFVNGRFKQVTSVGNRVYCSFTPFICDTDEGVQNLPDGSHFSGKLTMLEKRKIWQNPLVGNADFVNNSIKKAHSGQQCMKLTGAVFFDQPKVKLLKNKSYVLSMWISRDNTDVTTYSQPLLVQASTVQGSNFLEISTATYTYGKVVEGWQKLDIEFTLQDGIYAPEDGPIDDHERFGINFNPGSAALYIDDIRLSPKTGGLATHVYDPLKFWLRASSNVDNYATFYYYDEEGNLTLKKQETERGVFTIMEARGHRALYRIPPVEEGEYNPETE